MSRLRRDDIEQFFELGLHIGTRTVYIGSTDANDAGEENGTDYRMAERAIKALHVLDAQSSEPITIIMNNMGGDVYHGLAMYDAIRVCRSPVTVRGTGYVMSMGAVILQAADVRQLTPNTRVMIHHGDFAHDGAVKTVQRWAADQAAVDRWMEDLFVTKMQVRHPTMTRQRVRGMLVYDTILDAPAAVALGLADEVVE